MVGLFALSALVFYLFSLKEEQEEIDQDFDWDKKFQNEINHYR